MDQAEYNNLFNYTTAMLKTNGLVSQSASDIISDAYIKMVEKRTKYSFDNISRFIISSIIRAKHQIKYVELFEANLKVCDPIFNIPPNKEGYKKTCRLCGEELPYSSFYVHWNRDCWCWGSYCKSCNWKRNKDKYKLYKGYVIRLLKRKHSLEYLKTHPWVVRRKENELINKRNKVG